jgi:hypothetical protein
MADDLDVEFGPRRRSGKGVPNIDVLDFSLGFSLRDYIEYTSTCCVVNAGMMRSGGSSHETDEDEQDNRSKRSRNDLSDEIAACEQSKTRQQPASNKPADDANHDIPGGSKAITLYDDPSQEPCDCADQQQDQQSFNLHDASPDDYFVSLGAGDSFFVPVTSFHLSPRSFLI